LLNLKYHDWNGILKSAADKGKQGADKAKKGKVVSTKHNPATHSLADFAGLYKNPGYGAMKLFISTDSLFVKTVTHTLWLRHADYDIFDVFDKDPKEGIDTSEDAQLKVQFRMNLGGEIDGLESVFEAGLKPIVFTKEIEAKKVTAAELAKYTGNYALAGLTAKVYVKDGKTLYVLVPGQPDYEMVPLGNDKFAVKILTGYYLQFGPPGAAKITEATFIQPNGSFKAARK